MYENIFAKSQLQPVKMRDVAYDMLRQAIITNKLPPQTRLLEEHLARELNISRTPLREALKALENEGFVQRLLSGGYQVAPLSVKELDNLYSIRLVLEGLAARQAAVHITPEELSAAEEWNEQMKSHWLKQRIDEALQAGRAFHVQIYRASRNENLAVLLQRLSDQIARYRYYSIIYRVPEAYEDHAAILAALRVGDGAQAEALLQAHVEAEHRLVVSKMRERAGAEE
ncbi:GntR family transcriptional regulator [Chloroflexus sp.]|uniref:GntR family transcriptional regulator n=1 Tax=Chloroflexus sp. TaxID=1904827 RepID=UPI00298F07D8|nr:GntR family transcriptional regulator [Chloroflexus sp.]MDW8403828.1 GntR family transcriptional regulator [Chloroflexus sp.]